jgi:hypothetical protein
VAVGERIDQQALGGVRHLALQRRVIFKYVGLRLS